MYRAFVKAKCAPRGVMPIVYCVVCFLHYDAKPTPETTAQPHLEECWEAPGLETTSLEELSLALRKAHPESLLDTGCPFQVRSQASAVSHHHPASKYWSTR